MIWLVGTESTRCSECGFPYNELAQVEKPWLLMFTAVVSLYVTAVRLLFHCSEFIFRLSERSLPCDILKYDIIVEMLCWYDYVCLTRIDRHDDWMNDVHVSTLAQAYTWDITNESLNYDMTPKCWVICKLNRLIATPRCWVARDWVAWQTWSARFYVRSDISICTIEIEWNDRRG